MDSYRKNITVLVVIIAASLVLAVIASQYLIQVTPMAAANNLSSNIAIPADEEAFISVVPAGLIFSNCGWEG